MNLIPARKAERLLLIALILIFFVLLFLLNSTGASAVALQEAQPLSQTEMLLSDVPGSRLEESGDEHLPQDQHLPPFPQDPLEAAADSGLLLAGASASAGVLSPAAAAAPYSLGEGSSRKLQVKVHVANSGETESTAIRLDVPLLGMLDSPYQVILEESYSHEVVEIKELEMLNRRALFEIASLPPGGSETVTLTYKLKVYPISANLDFDPGRSEPQPHTEEFLQPVENIESAHSEIKARAEKVTSALDDPLDRARALFNFVIEHMSYDRNAANRNGGALAALRSGTGVCEDYAALFVALCRASGIPARQVNGYTDPRGTGEEWQLAPGEVHSLRGYRHSWAEFYIPGLGWLPADPTMDIYRSDSAYFASLPQAAYLAQNYMDQSLRASYRGGQLAVTWDEQLIGK